MTDDFRVKVTADTTQAESDIDQLINKIENRKITLNVEVGKDQAKQLASNIEKGLKSTKIDSSGLAKQLADSFNITDKSVINKMKRQIDSMMSSLANSWNGEKFNYSQATGFYTGLDDLAETAARNANVLQSKMGIYDKFYDYFKNKKIYISEDLKNALGNDEYKELLRNNIGKITKDATKGISIDSIWGEMTSLFPEHFSDDIVNQADQVRRAFEVLRNARADIDSVIPASALNQQQMSNITESAFNETADIARNIRDSLERNINAASEESKMTFDVDVQINKDKIISDIREAIQSGATEAVEIRLNVNDEEIRNSIQSALSSLGTNGEPIQVNAQVDRQSLQDDINAALDGLELPIHLNIDSGEIESQIREAINNIQDLEIDVRVNTDEIRDSLNNNDDTDLTFDGNIDTGNASELQSILSNINATGAQGESVFDDFGNTLRDAFSTFTVANLLQEAIFKIIEAGDEAIATVKELNDATVSLQMATGDSYIAVKDMMKQYNDLGQELGAITSDVAEGADAWLRQGKTAKETNALIKDSMILSKVSNLNAAESTEYLTASMNGYKVAIEDAMSIVDKVSSVDLVSATDAGGLMEAMSRVATTADMAGVSMDKLLGYASTIGEVTQDPMTSIGDSLKTIFTRMSDIKANKLELVDEDGTSELLSDVELTLSKVGINLRKTVTEYNSYSDVLDNLASKWDTLNQTQQNALSKAFAGTRQQNRFRVLMENYDRVLKYTDVAANSAGTAEEKFQEAYLNSLEAKTNSLKASLENLATSTISDKLYAGVLDTAKAMVDLTEQTGILKGALVGLGSAGSLFAFQQLASWISRATHEFSNLGTALQIVRSPSAGSLLNERELSRLIQATAGLSDAQIGLVLSNASLSDAQMVAILMARGQTEAEAEATIATLGLATAEGGATGATLSLSASLRGLWATLISNPLFLITAGITAVATAYSAHKRSVEEMMSAAREEATAWQESNTSLQSHIEKVTELKAQLESGNLTEEESYNVKSQLLDIQNQLIDTYGQMASGIDLVNGNLETQISLMNQISAEEANKYLTENKRSIEKAEKAMEKNRNYFVNTYSDDNAQRLQAVKDAISKNGLKGVTNDDGSISISFEGTAADAEKALNGFASDIRDIQKQYGDYGFLEIMLNNIESKVGDAKDILDEYQDIYNTARTAELTTDKTKISTSYNGDRTYSDVAKDYADAIEEYNKALMNLDDAESLDSAEQKFNAVQMAVDQIIASVPGYATVFDGLREQLNEAAIQTVNLNDALKDGSSKGLKTYADKIKKLNINDKEFIASLNDADSATGELSTSLVEAAQSAGLIGSSDVEVQKLIDALINAGIIAGQTSDAITEAFDINATPLLDAYNEATESENQGDNYLKFAEALEKAKEDYDKGLVGTDDFKSAAKMFSPTGMDDAANFEENYNRIKKYFDKDSAKGVQAFLKDLEALNKGYAEFDKSTGTWKTDFDDLEQAAKDMGMGFEPFMAVLKRMDDYGASSNFFATTKEGMDHLSELYRELAQEEMTLAQLKQTDPNNKTAIDATQEKIDTLKSSIQESIGYLEQLTNMEAKDFDAQVTGAKEAYESLRQQKNKVLSEGGENAQSVAQMIQTQMDNLARDYFLEIDAKGNITYVNPPKETPEIEVKANLEIPTDVDLNNRPQVSAETMKNSGWDIGESDYATVYTSAYSNEDGTKTVVVTPILPNGEVLTEKQLENYASQLLEGKEIDANIKLGMFEGEDSIQQANDYADSLHLVQEAYYGDDKAIKKALSSLKKFNYEQLKDIDFNDGQWSEGEKEVEGLLDALGLTTDQAEMLLKVLQQMGLVDLPDLSDMQEQRAMEQGWKPVMAQSPEEYLSENPIEIPGEVTIKNPEQLQKEAEQNPLRMPVVPELQPTDSQTEEGQTADTATIKVDADNSEANAKIQESVDKANESTGTVKIDGDNSPAKTKTDETVKYIDSQTAKINIEAKDNIGNNIQNALNGKTFKINADVNVNVRNTGDNSGKSKQASVNGTPFITSARFNNGYLGVAHANGTVGEKKDIDALTGELGEELVVRGNRFFTVGKNGAEMVHLKKGDIVFNHEQTKQLLSRGYINGRGKALAQGNARGGTGGNALKFQGGAAGNKLDNGNDDKSNKSTKENTKEKDKNTKSVKRSTQVFDWVAKRLEYFANKTKQIADTITDYVQLAFKKAQLNKQMDAINKEITANTRGANAYLRKANNVAKNYKYYDDNGKAHSVSVSAQYKKLVQQGKYKKIKYKIEEMDTSKEQKAALAEAIQKYDEYYNKSQDCKQAVIDLRNEQLELYEQWANIPTEQAEKKIDSLDLSLKQLERDYAKLGNYNVSAMNKNIDQQTENARKQNNEYQKALKEANANFDNADNNYSNKKTALLKNKKLSDKQKKAIENGNEISTVGITDKKLLKQVNAYNMALQKKTIATDAQSEALKNATESEKNYYETMQANSQTKFDNIATAYENQIAALEHTGNMMNAYMNRAETMGFITSKKYYQILQNVEASNLEQLKQEKAALIASLEESVRNGSIVKYSTDWYDMKGKIDDVTESIEESTTAMIEYNNSIRDLDWQIFDLIQERISYVTDEADFLINLMSNSKLYEDNGQLTDKGTATMGLHGLNYNVAMAQADDYAKKIAELDAEIASSQEKANDQNLLKKRQEYIELQRDSILAAEDEKQAIKDMVSEGIEKELDALKELIDKYNEVMDSQKDLYDYQKKIKDQTKEIAKLEKQLAVYKSDKSEEAKATVQKIKVSLEDARENLKESEYDKYVSDQKKLLDDLYSEYEDVLNERLDDLDTLIQDMINQLNDENSTINKTIRGVASDVGVDLSSEMKKIWDGDTTLSSVLKSYSTDFSKLTTISDTLAGIKEDIAKMVINSDKKAEEQTKDGVGSEVKKSASSASSNVDTLGKNIKNGGGSTSTNGKSDPANTLMAVDSVDTLKSKVTALFKTLKSKKLTKKELNKHSSLFKHIYNKTNNRNITDDKILTLGKTLGVKNLPKKAENLTAANKKEILNKLRTIGGYKTGTRSVLKDGYAWTQEDGQEFIIRKKDGGILTPVKREDMIFNKAASKNLYDFANNPPGFINGLSGIGNVDIPSSVVNKNVGGDVYISLDNVVLPNVTNYKEFYEGILHDIPRDPKAGKMLRAITTDQLFGGSSLKKYK